VLRVSVSTVRFRLAAEGNLSAVVEAYNAGIEDRLATFETQPGTVADLAGWLTDGQPFLVAERDGHVVGYARAGAYSDRCVYSGVGEHAVYVARDARGQGLGRQLFEQLAAECERRSFYALISRVFSDNPASLAAHRAAGFEEVGTQRRHGKLDGTWKDCVLVERLLAEAASSDQPTHGAAKWPPRCSSAARTQDAHR
jgi:L-amino acid N-acyltransferase YncA